MTLEFELSHQAKREAVLSSWLDIYQNQFKDKLASLTEDEIESLSGPVEQYIVQLVGPDTDFQLMLQAVASMSDQTLHEAVRLFGVDPLPDIKYEA